MPQTDAKALAKRWYRSKRWQQLRAEQLERHPWCQCPHHAGQKLPADHPDFGGPVVDHNPPHRGDKRAFFDKRRLQTMTKRCHDAFKQSQERGGVGFLAGCDERGWPLSGEHEWHEVGRDA